LNLDYATVFSLAPYVNENVITIIGICLLIGAMAKSSQVGLHVWLPMAMEGLKVITFFIIRFFGITDLIYFTYFNSSCSNVPAAFYLSGAKKFAIKTCRKECIWGLHTNNQGSFIWVYDITKLSDNHSCLVEGAPFGKKKTECAEILKTTRKSVTLYLDSNKIFNNKWIFSSIELSKEQKSKFLWEMVILQKVV
jgi:hypothetical protein